MKISFLGVLAAVSVLLSLFILVLVLRLLPLFFSALTIQFHRLVHQILSENDAIGVLPYPRCNRLHLQVQQREMPHCALEVFSAELEPGVLLTLFQLFCL